MSFVYILSNCCAFFSNKTGNRLYRKSFKNNMQTCGVIKNHPVHDTVSKEPVEVGVWNLQLFRKCLLQVF